VPRICWDNREHHFWDGFSGGFLPRNTIVNDVNVVNSVDERSVCISFFYIANFIKVTQSWRFEEPEEEGVLSWDTTYRFENRNSFAVKDYAAFFACYHQAGTNYYWHTDETLSKCADSFSAAASEKRQLRARRLMASYAEIVKGWGIKNPTRAQVLYAKPVLASREREWFNNGQHVILVEPEKCLSVVSAMNQARDYMLCPEQDELGPQETFTARVRHIVGKTSGIDDLKRRWDLFVNSLAESRATRDAP